MDFKAVLAQMVDEVGKVWYQSILRAFQSAADAEKAKVEKVLAMSPEERGKWFQQIPWKSKARNNIVGRYFLRKDPVSSYGGQMEVYDHGSKAFRPVTIDDYAMDTGLVEKDAQIAYNDSRDFFVHRNNAKLRSVTIGREPTDTKMDVRFQNGVIVGNIHLTFASGDKLTANTSLKYNMSKLGTPFMQYPTLFYLNGSRVSQEDLMKDFAKEEKPEALEPVVDTSRVFSLKDIEKLNSLLIALTQVETGQRFTLFNNRTNDPAKDVRRLTKALGIPDTVTKAEVAKMLKNTLGLETMGLLTEIQSKGSLPRPEGSGSAAKAKLFSPLNKLNFIRDEWENGSVYKLSPQGVRFLEMLDN